MASPLDCEAYKTEAFRLQAELNLPLPYAEGSPYEKHMPYILLNGTVGQVVVGKGAITGVPEDGVHPMEDRVAFDALRNTFLNDCFFLQAARQETILFTAPHLHIFWVPGHPFRNQSVFFV